MTTGAADKAKQQTDETLERIRALNEQVLQAGRDLGQGYLDAYEQTMRSFADFQERTAQGTDLRAGEVTELSELIAQRETAIARQAAQLSDLQQQVERLTAQAGTRNVDVATAQSAAAAGAVSAGLVALTGPGVVITLDDAPARPDGSLPVDARPDDLVIHQSDVQAVVNAVWAAASPMAVTTKGGE